MKKKIIITAIIAVVAIVACVGFNINFSKRATTLIMENIEALARGEGGSEGYDCWSSWTSGDGTFLKCGSCWYTSGLVNSSSPNGKCSTTHF